MRLIVQLPKDRTRLGLLRLEFGVGETMFWCPCYGKADTAGAVAHNNPTRDPTKPYGDFAAGEYRMEVIEADPNNVTKFGHAQRIQLTGVAGDALAGVENGRFGILIHGGDLRNGELRPTFGCLRLQDSDMMMLIDVVERYAIDTLVAAGV